MYHMILYYMILYVVVCLEPETHAVRSVGVCVGNDLTLQWSSRVGACVTNACGGVH